MFDNLQLLFVWAPIINVQVILDGIFVGAVFALCAYGLALVWGVMNIKNLAQGDFVILGGYLALVLHSWNLPLPVILVIVTIIMFVYGWSIYALIIRRIVDKDMFVSLLATFGLSLLMQQAMNLYFGPEVQTIDMKLPVIDAFDNMVTIPYSKIISLALAGIITAAVVIFMKKSRTGQAIRATAQDARAARVLGIDTDRVYAFTFAFNSALCGAAGVLVSVIWVIQPFYGITYSVRTFAIVTAAGLGNLPGVISAAFGIGLFEKYTGMIVGTAYEVAAPVMILLLVLIIRQIHMKRNRQVVR
ncbi:MAG: branched-chain amino acid ABC transporter permease [Rhodobacteraceae bacterium]|jgi:branched-chain amino acid transport system permease protein|nr:branched-chain amino acid ABC transporter permease [Paracoccaceae bacterium]MBT4284619.1 branched-chain amino acid ABC transporter permease [Paracoccaceae bacterium]MBT6270772.1 branched-chain amino acid ABC transporter permease [Paracoccaceae bacterium]MBT6437807.1 branched-chain amino acid ABC transporter permease [Paracoccaceae bacterium]MDG2374565.1 branched-chain amino acid ABC transporter permease [Paracoccaceae bacterium]|tara:strand:- start:9176 stop:10081 length:906 start_codon:yes stop_codon:yes gene_type:complete